MAKVDYKSAIHVSTSFVKEAGLYILYELSSVIGLFLLNL